MRPTIQHLRSILALFVGAFALAACVAEPKELDPLAVAVPTTVTRSDTTTTAPPNAVISRILFREHFQHTAVYLNHVRHEVDSYDSAIWTFQDRLFPSSWTVLDLNGRVIDEGELTIEFHRGAPDEEFEWVGISNGCWTTGWVVGWVEAGEDFGVMRRRLDQTIQLEPECDLAPPAWPFPRGWIRADLDKELLYLGRADDTLTARRTADTPSGWVDPLPGMAEAPTELRAALMGAAWNVQTEEPSDPSTLAFTNLGADWVGLYNGCGVRAVWIEEWTADGFRLASDKNPPYSLRKAGSIGGAQRCDTSPAWLDEGFVEVRLGVDSITLGRDSVELILDRSIAD